MTACDSAGEAAEQFSSISLRTTDFDHCANLTFTFDSETCFPAIEINVGRLMGQEFKASIWLLLMAPISLPVGGVTNNLGNVPYIQCKQSCASARDVLISLLKPSPTSLLTAAIAYATAFHLRGDSHA